MCTETKMHYNKLIRLEYDNELVAEASSNKLPSEG